MIDATNNGGRVLVADDHPLTREGLALAARSAIPGCAIDHAGSLAEAVAAIRNKQGYRLALLDLILPDTRGFSGFLQLEQLLGGVPIAIVSARCTPKLVEVARMLGAAAYLPKSLPLDELARAVRTIVGGGRLFPAAVAETAAVASVRERIKDLSDAQLRVLLALADGRLNKQIAADLSIAEATVKAHMTAIFRKLGVNNRAQALLATQPILGDADDAP